MPVRYRVHMLDGSAHDVDAPSSADARARFENRGISRVKVIRGAVTPAQIEARLAARSRRHILPFALSMLVVSAPALARLLGGVL